jgi:hypothetical protein
MRTLCTDLIAGLGLGDEGPADAQLRVIRPHYYECGDSAARLRLQSQVTGVRCQELGIPSKRALLLRWAAKMSGSC